MIKLKKIRLNFKDAWEYVKDDLDGTNELSAELLKLLNLKMGIFLHYYLMMQT